MRAVPYSIWMTDYVGGHITGAVNVPAELWYSEQHVDSVIDERVAGRDTVVVHCMFSQQRGPRCAMRLASRLAARSDVAKPAVYVLRGGFTGFAAHYRHEQDLVEDYDEAFYKR
ncbi:rhodanese domain phosphatase 2 [Tetrabaena socialis]|uniref:protein-tyrosine-phosphatase n=1 Tax=Tetrabaena socialis TaxID=47790 RepID=A0A2J8A8N3_9CHLO|nr:rhodanese domain phosphatase 2 [Tetrabaena socialis]|eukprot:PNH08878.1 rhodanese domain phosphatase 2 [Tetrabaena socialis]